MEPATSETPLTKFLAGQTLTQLRALKAQYREEIEATRQREVVLEAELDRIDQAIQEKSGTRTRSRKAAANDERVPRNGKRRGAEPALREMILRVMGQRDGSWTKQDIYQALDRIGHAPKGKNPMNTIGNRLLEMAARHEIERAERGKYQLPNGSKGMGRDPLLMGNATQEAGSEGA